MHRSGRRGFKKVVNEKKQETATDFDALFQVAADLRGHILMTMRNCAYEDWSIAKITQFLSLFAFLNSRHTWNASLLSMPEPELFEIYQYCRRTLVERVDKLSLGHSNEVFFHFGFAPTRTFSRCWKMWWLLSPTRYV